VLKETDDKLRRAGEELERRVIERTEQLYMAIMQLETEMAERKRSEDALRDSEGKLNAILSSISDYMVMVDRDLNILWCNEKAKEAFNIVCEGAKCYEALCGRDRPCGTEPCYALKTFQDGDIHEDEAILINRSGQVLYCHCVANVAFRDQGSQPTAILKVLRDITEKKQTEREKKSLEERLRRSEKMEAIGTLAGGVAHDFNNILSAIMGYTELAVMNISQDQKAYSDLEEVLRASRRARDLVGQILAFSCQREHEKRPILLGPIIKESSRLLRASLPTTIDITHDIVSEDTVLADPTQVHQIIMNLCTNAAHAMRETGGTLTVSLKQVSLEYTSHYRGLQPGNYLQLTVSDTGHGIDPAIIGRIFDPYFTTK